MRLVLNVQLQTREQIHQCLSDYHRYNLAERQKLREIRAIYKGACWLERSYLYRERAKAANYPDINISLIIDGAAQE
jgi:hypothetical protein